MICHSQDAETSGILHVAQGMCVAARTAPKARGIDHIDACYLTGGEKETLAAEMDRLGKAQELAFFIRDAQNVRDSAAVVLIGASLGQRGLNEACRYCHYQNCAECASQNGVCAFDPMDLGIALGSAVSVAAAAHVDNRIMFSVGKAAISLGCLGEEMSMVLGIPLSAKGKSPYFDRG
ncbi:DUF2148 domain-containing protein [Eubacterium sp. 1001713B170207_170306_E7]|uniref:ferredoxin domain-containing protein n=1 Tax=Eubacterium sp. 1001713B170207_170306_E7 TaxID=2787097 RepID=UPI001898920B|nr:DUF2148 domain-containing protein [Eubacterium sp. 1001713B170207_170306_E7]